ncbi:MAG: hypothetical protein L6R41_006929 [Letrouitia leprolyta]|nr:MAG: hypothetical protein L6R41_006929 [Letrouitia leprolyta]
MVLFTGQLRVDFLAFQPYDALSPVEFIAQQLPQPNNKTFKDVTQEYIRIMPLVL